MNQQLQALQQESGATIASISDASETGAAIAVTFGNDDSARQAAQTNVALYDRSHWGRILVSDSDRLRFLHNQTTNDFNRLQPGQGCDTVFVTSTARTIDLATAYATDDAVLLLVSPNRRQYLMDWMDRFIFFSDKVALKDITSTTAAFSLIGPHSLNLLEKLGGGAIANQPYANHAVVNLAGVETRIAVGSGLAIAGYTLIVDVNHAASLWKSIADAGAVLMGETAWEQLRIEQGRPTSDRELTDDVNPLEAGLWQTISLNKGCYIGQETIARLHTYKGVKQQLWGIRLTAPVASGSTVTYGDEKIGKLTSCTQISAGYFGLAYIRTKAAEAGLIVQVEGSQGELVSVPFVSHEYI